MEASSTLDARDVEFKDNSASYVVRPRSAAPPCHPAARARARRRRRRSQRALTPTRRTRLRSHAIQGGVSLIQGGTATFTSCAFTSNSAGRVRLRSPPAARARTRSRRCRRSPPPIPSPPPPPPLTIARNPGRRAVRALRRHRHLRLHAARKHLLGQHCNTASILGQQQRQLLRHHHRQLQLAPHPNCGAPAAAHTVRGDGRLRLRSRSSPESGSLNPCP